MIGSVIERMKSLKRLKIQTDESFTLEIKRGKIIVAELMVQVHEISYNVLTKESDVKISVINPFGMTNKTTITEFSND